MEENLDQLKMQKKVRQKEYVLRIELRVCDTIRMLSNTNRQLRVYLYAERHEKHKKEGNLYLRTNDEVSVPPIGMDITILQGGNK